MTAKEMVWLSAFAAPVAAMPMALDSNRGQHQLPTADRSRNDLVKKIYRFCTKLAGVGKKGGRNMLMLQYVELQPCTKLFAHLALE